MSPVIALYVIIALVIGAFAGWNARTARGASADLKVHKARIPNFRRVRTRSSLISLALLVLTLLAVRALIR
jgi:membrane protein required for beta-lactamase induction